MPLINLIQNKAWALHPSKLDEIDAFINARLEDPSAQFEVARGRSGNRADDRYQINDGVAVIPAYGVMDKRANMFMEISGGTSTELLKRDIKQALEDPAVESIVLDIDSPGGSVDGTKELADFIFESRGKKPIIAYANGLMASAAYWIGSAADSIIANDTAMVGSIGVALTHYDKSEADAQNGIKRTTIYAGKYKRIASDEKPLSEEGAEYLQSMVDTYYALFVESVAQHRGADVETVIKRMADGREFIGKKALKAGLVDYIGNLDTALDMAREKGETMDVKTLQEKHPEVHREIFDLGQASVDIQAIKTEAEQAGVAEERARVVKILGAEADPKETLKAIEGGIPAAEAFEAFYLAEKENRSARIESLQTEQPESAGHGAVETGKAKNDYMKLVDAYRAEHKCGLGAAMQAIAKSNPEVHQAWLDSQKKKEA